MLFQLLVPAGGLTVAFCRINDATARHALSLGRKAENPQEPNQSG
jgi:hypothetical protein